MNGSGVILHALLGIRAAERMPFSFVLAEAEGGSPNPQPGPAAESALGLRPRIALSSAQLRRNLNEARASIGEFLESVYNRQRLHSALGYVPPAEFEQNAEDIS